MEIKNVGLKSLKDLLDSGDIDSPQLNALFLLLIPYIKEKVEELSVLMGSYYGHLTLSQWIKENLSRKRSGSLLNPSLASLDEVFAEGLPYTSRVAFRDELDFLMVELLRDKLKDPVTVMSYWLEEGISLENDLALLREAHQSHIHLYSGLTARAGRSHKKIEDAKPLLVVSDKLLSYVYSYYQRRGQLVAEEAAGLETLLQQKSST